MKSGTQLILALALLAAGGGAMAEEVAGLPLHVQRLDDAAIRVWVGDHISSTATIAIATDDGIVVFDTVGNPLIDAQLRQVIARELGRDDFRYLVNTHEHSDHTWGNSVYADCTIVGHERVAAGMVPRAGNRDRILQWRREEIAEFEKQLADPPADPAAAAKLREQLIVAQLSLANHESEPEFVAPTKTFTGRMTLRVGGTTIDMYDISGMHSESDIAILIPEHGLLLTGDTMSDRWLTDTPGCLASFMARPGVPHDFPRMLANWDLLLARKNDIRLLLPGHWNGELSIAGFAARVEYVRALWDGVQAGIAAGKSLADLQTELALDTRFPELATSPGCNVRTNRTTVQEMYCTATGQESAAQRLYALIDEGAEQNAVRAVVAARDARPARYFYDENEVNGHGYRFLQENRVPQAIAMFRAYVELFPESWNAYDSLGEALLAAGDVAGATAMYEKSLALNPASQSGKDALARIRGEGAAQ